MVYTCCVPGCKTGYKGTSSKVKIQLFSFPSNTELEKKWVAAIPRKQWTVGSSHKVCALHFSNDNFEHQSSDTFNKRRLERESQDLKRLRLKKTAIPHVFNELPKYLQKKSNILSETTASSSARHEKVVKRLEVRTEEFFLDDQVDDLEILRSKIKNETLPSGYVICNKNDSITFYYLFHNSDLGVTPKLLASVTVGSTMSVYAHVHSYPLNTEKFEHLLINGSLKNVTALCNILSLCKSLADKERSGEDYFATAISALKSFLQQCEDCNHQQTLIIDFFIEQLQLMCKCEQARRYSPEVVTLAFLWQLTSTSLYKKLRELFILPSITTLRKYSSGLNVSPSHLDITYLKQRSEKLSSQERTVTLMLDEVYTAQRIEYCNGCFVGLTDEGTAAKTVLTFMVQSACSSYKDVVCLVPVSRLDTALLKTWFHSVVQALSEIFFIVAVSADNHVCNRKLFVDLCGGNLKPYIDHPTRPREKLFLLFDFTHNFKNIFNCFCNKKHVSPPTSGFEHILGNTCDAQFAHIKQLYAIEEDMLLKVSHKLRKSSLNPSSISRTSPLHASGIFHESTAAGLEYYSSKHPEFLQTSRFIKFIGNIWKIMSLRSPCQGFRTRDDLCWPIKLVEENSTHTSSSIKYLLDVVALMRMWKQSGRRGLTAETFTACLQSMESMCELSKYLLQQCNFNYVLPGKCTSDPIEGRFGWYRQVNGENFYMSVNQLFQAEKKIRALSLLQQHSLEAASFLQYSSGKNDVPSTSNSLVDGKGWLVELFNELTFFEFSESDSAVTYFVAGYIGRSISRRRKCQDCTSLLVHNKDHVSEFEDMISENALRLLNLTDRGGLCHPSEYCFAVCVLATHFYKHILSDDDMKRRFFSCSNPRSLFIAAVFQVARLSEIHKCLVDEMCVARHENFEWILQTAFNCFAKNELKRFNSPNMEPPEKMSRKIRKLTSKTSKEK